jgi:hypothetical protein
VHTNCTSLTNAPLCIFGKNTSLHACIEEYNASSFSSKNPAFNHASFFMHMVVHTGSCAYLLFSIIFLSYRKQLLICMARICVFFSFVCKCLTGEVHIAVVCQPIQITCNINNFLPILNALQMKRNKRVNVHV